MYGRYVVAAALALLSLSACGGPEPPEEYRRNFDGALELNIVWDTGPPNTQTVPTAALNFAGVGVDDEGRTIYAVSTFPFICDLDLVREGVGTDAEGGVTFNVVVPDVPCEYDDTSGNRIVVRPTVGSARWWPERARHSFTADVESYMGDVQQNSGTLSLSIDAF